MSKEFPGISKDTYLKSTGEAQDGLTYDMLTRIHHNVGDMGGRVTAIEKRKKIDTTLAGTTGLIGGVIAFLMQVTFFKKI